MSTRPSVIFAPFRVKCVSSRTVTSPVVELLRRLLLTVKSHLSDVIYISHSFRHECLERLCQVLAYDFN